MTLASLDLWRSRATGARQARRFSVAIDAVALFLTVTGIVLLTSKDSLSASHGSSLTLAAPGLLTLGASLLGLPIGDHPARPPQTAFPDDLKQPIRQAYVDSGFIES